MSSLWKSLIELPGKGFSQIKKLVSGGADGRRHSRKSSLSLLDGGRKRRKSRSKRRRKSRRSRKH
jgi:hypothetical protein